MKLESPPVDWTGKLPRQILNDFRNAETVDDYLEHLEQLDEIEEVAREFFSIGPGRDEKIINIRNLPAIQDTENNTYYQFRANIEPNLIRMIYLRVDPTGPKIDYHAYARTCSHSWDELISGKVPEAPEMRLALRMDNFYLGEFQDDSVWQCFRGVSPELEEQLSLYLRLDKLPENLKRIMNRGKLVRATVSLKSVGNSHERKQFEISNIHHLSWLSLPTK